MKLERCLLIANTQKETKKSQIMMVHWKDWKILLMRLEMLLKTLRMQLTCTTTSKDSHTTMPGKIGKKPWKNNSNQMSKKLLIGGL